VILLELEQDILAGSRTHTGPPISKFTESTSFLEKHLAGKDTLSGPWIEGNKWVVLKKRNCTSSITLLKTALKHGGRNVGVASEPVRTFKRKVKILSGASIGRLLTGNPEFARALTVFLSGRPAWLE
jgi:tRNA nucleotidyltransferase (CCA-adding enzyme)